MPSPIPNQYKEDMERSLPYDNQHDEIKSQFDSIFSAIFSINSNSSEDDVRALNERIQREVTAKPILAKIVQGNSSLLDACIVRLADMSSFTLPSNF